MPLSHFYDVLRADDGSRYIVPFVDGFQLLRLPLLNKGTAFTHDERARLGLEGLLPPRVNDIEAQLRRTFERYRAIEEPIERHSFLRLLQDRNEVLFFAMVERHLEEMLPIIYTPTVGLAVQRFSSSYLVPRGLTISAQTADVEAALDNVPLHDVRMIVATDASAILGIGDQGIGGMEIAIGKLSIYTVAGGIGPDKTLPVKLDVGTDRGSLREDPNYLGIDAPRLKGDAYLRVVDAFVTAATRRWPKAVIQWEDLSKDTAFAVLERYRRVVPSFNDDIQGTGAVTLAGVRAACRLKGQGLSDQRIVISGAGAGGIGVAWALVEGMRRAGLSRDEALDRVIVLDSRGVLGPDREVEGYKRPFVQRASAIRSLREALGRDAADASPIGLADAVRAARATVLIGLSGQGGQFDEPLVRSLLEWEARPIVFPLSNPTEATEVLPADLVAWTDGTALFATGSPFPPVEHGGVPHPVAQGNNAFVFPGIGFGAVLARAHEITDGMVLAAADALADYTAERHPERIYPPVRDLREASIHVAARVIAAAAEDRVARELSLGALDLPALESYVRERAWQARYLPFRPPAPGDPATAT